MTQHSFNSVFDWLYAEYGSKFTSHYFDQGTEERIKQAQSEMKQAAATAALEQNPIKKLEQMIRARDMAIECTQLLHDQTHRVYLAVIGLLAKQVSQFEEPQLPDEFRAYLELQHQQMLSGKSV